MSSKPLVAAAILAAACGLTQAAAAQSGTRPVPDTYTAVTTGMTPDGLMLKMDIREWSDEAKRADVVSALMSDDDVRSALIMLPTIGYVWVTGSSVGYSIKYAYREPTDDGGQRVTLVTDRPLGSYAFKGWEVPNSPVTSELEYSVIELVTNGNGGGIGTVSLAAEPRFDEANHLVSLDAGDNTLNVLTDVKLEPKPYWAKSGASY